MRIGIDARLYGPKITGIGNYTKELISHLAQCDHENEYFIFLSAKEFDDFVPPSDQFRKIKIDIKWYGWKEQLWLWRIFEKQKPDLMHVTNFNVPIFLTCPFVVTLHDMTPYYFPGPYSSKIYVRRLAYLTVLNSAVRRSKMIITVSHGAKKQITKLYPIAEDKTRVTHLGINPAMQRESNYVIIDNVKKKFGITKPYIFYIGVWRDHKNIPGLLRAFEILVQKHGLDLQLVLGGSQKDADTAIFSTLKEMKAAKNVIKTGFIEDSDLPALYSGARMTAIPSFMEGFGMHATESIMCGTPVAASKTTPIQEIVRSGAQYFDPKSPEDMAKVLKKVFTDETLRRNLVKNGREAIRQLSWDRCAKETLAVYHEAIRKK